jgi:hypothetical protein
MGVMMLIAGVVGVIVAGGMSKSAYESRQPERAAAGLGPRPGAGDVPGWISGVYLLSFLSGIVGLIVLVTG